MFQKKEPLDPAFPLNKLPEELLDPILSHLNIKELVADLRLVNKNWRTIADKLIKEKIEVKKAALERRYLAIQNESEVKKVDPTIRKYILEAAEYQYLPLLWEKPLASDDDSTKQSFNKALQKDIISIIKEPIPYPFAFTEQKEAELLSANLQNADFSYIDDGLNWIPMYPTNLRAANFTGCELGFITLNHMDLSATNFTNTKLMHINFIGSNLSKTDCSNVEFDNCKLNGANIIGANFSGAIFNSTELSNLNFKNVNFTNADFTSAIGLNAETLLFASHLQGIKLPESFNFEYMNLSELDFSNASMMSVMMDKTDLSHTNMTNVNLKKSSVGFANFYEANLTNATLDYVDFSDTNITAEQLLSAGSLREIKIEKSNFTNEEVNLIKSKMLNDYKDFFKTNRFDDILNLLVEIESDETHTLKIQRDFSLKDYGLTASYSDVINYGRKRLVELSKNLFFEQPEPHSEQYNKLQQIFNAPIYNWHSSSFWVSDDNAAEALKSILGQASEDVDYQFSPKK
jgi:uncharacterized protein YjbI with pentapeptide repeats